VLTKGFVALFYRIVTNLGIYHQYFISIISNLMCTTNLFNAKFIPIDPNFSNLQACCLLILPFREF